MVTWRKKMKKTLKLVIFTILFHISYSLFGGITIDVERKTYIISIGVNKFQSGQLELQYCVADAQSFYDSFPEIEEEYKLLLTDEKATHDSIVENINQILSRMENYDTLLIYVATHGMFDENNYYFTPYDFNFNNYPIKGISSNWLLEQLSFMVQNNSNNIVLFLDTCHSGAFGFDIRKSFNTSSRTGLALLYSCSPLELSLEGEQYGGHGLFTYTILEGLSGKADKNNDSIITFRELFDYAYLRVKELSNDEQNPVFIGGMDNKKTIKKY
jgi:uncharacterized caspase-like protein